MTATALDTSVLVAASLGWHEAHDPCVEAVSRAMERELVLPQSALVEAYAVMTRLPAPHRLRSADAMGILEGSFRDRARIAALRARSTWSLLSRARDSGVIGGLTYDARILAEALQGGAGRLLTLNVGDFARLETGDLALVDPSSGNA